MTEVPRDTRDEETKDARPLEDVEEDLINTEEAPEEAHEEDSKEVPREINRDSDLLDTDLMNQIVEDHPSGDVSPQNNTAKLREDIAKKVDQDLEMEKEKSDLEEIKKSQDMIEKEWKELEDGI